MDPQPESPAGSSADLVPVELVPVELVPVELVMVGGGNMGAALLGGIVDSGVVAPDRLAVAERLDTRRSHLVERFPGVLVAADIPPCAAAVIAVKPGDVVAAVASAVAAGATRILSIAAGVTIASLEEAAGESVAVVRAMPNTPAIVRQGTSAISAGASADDDDLVWAESILGAVGIVDRLPESQLDAFTGVAGSGPAYVFLVAEALIDAAAAEGIERSTAERVVAQLLVGASALLERDGNAAALRTAVTSPGGTTAAGLAVFEAAGLRATVAEAVAAATQRSRELG